MEEFIVKKKLLTLLFGALMIMGMVTGNSKAFAYTVNYPTDGTTGVYTQYEVGNLLNPTYDFTYSYGTAYNFVGNRWNGIDKAYESGLGLKAHMTSNTSQSLTMYLQRWTGSRWVDVSHVGALSDSTGEDTIMFFRNEYSGVDLYYDKTIQQYGPANDAYVTGIASSQPHHSQCYRIYFSNPNATSSVKVSFYALGNIPALH